MPCHLSLLKNKSNNQTDSLLAVDTESVHTITKGRSVSGWGTGSTIKNKRVMASVDVIFLSARQLIRLPLGVSTLQDNESSHITSTH